MIPPTELQALLLAEMPDADIEVTDLTGSQDHYSVRIVRVAFEGKTRIAAHKLVYGALGERVGREIHARSLQTFSPASWQAKQG